MIKKQLLLSLLTITVVFSLVLSGCSSGVPQAQYDQVNTQLRDAQAQLSRAQNELTKAQSDKATVDKELAAAKTQISDLRAQLGQSSIVGATPAETAAKIVKNYHDTHVYTSVDYFICSDMSSEVWNMLKAQNISAVIVIGDIEKSITDILQSSHAWVVATIGSGQYLALETTGGYTVKQAQYPRYYNGWAFSSPADLKANNNLRNEYNTKVAFRNQLNGEANKAQTLYNNASTQAEADKYYTLYNKLVELRKAQETDLNNIMAKINALAKAVSY